MFKNLTVLHLEAAPVAADTLADQLAAGVLSPCGKLQQASAGWVSPYGAHSDVLAHWVGRCCLIRYGVEEKVLPTAVVRASLDERVREAAQRTGHPPGRREKLRLKDEVLMDLLPRAFVKPRGVDAYMDLEAGWLVIDTTSARLVEDLVTQLRMNVSGLRVVAPDIDQRACRLLTQWLSGGQLPQGFALGDECDLRDERDVSATIRCRRQDLDQPEIRKHLDRGMQAFKLGLTWNERLSFTLTDQFTMSRMQPMDFVVSQLNDVQTESPMEELDAQFALYSLEFRALLEQLAELLGWPQAD